MRLKPFCRIEGICANYHQSKGVPFQDFLLLCGHAITFHKSQESTLDYMPGDSNRSTGKKTLTASIINNQYFFPVPKDQLRFC